jgi:hypothetical protein
MARRKMVILRGNRADAGTFPDETGAKIAWPLGALHVAAAVEYAKRRGYEGVVLDVPGQPQSETSPQATAALKKFREDETVTAFYGFSGGGYNLKHILNFLAAHDPGALSRIQLIVVLGSPEQPKLNYYPSNYAARSKGKVDPGKGGGPNWEVVYRIDPDPSELPAGLPKGTRTHMFGPDVLLAQTPAGRYRDQPFDDC